jgi:hypothetical protein
MEARCSRKFSVRAFDFGKSEPRVAMEKARRRQVAFALLGYLGIARAGPGQ